MNTKDINGMIPVVINKCYGGFGLSDEAEKLIKLKQTNFDDSTSRIRTSFFGDSRRKDPILVEVVQELGEKANDRHAKLIIEYVPSEYEHCYTIHEYDGMETLVCDPDKLISYQLGLLKTDTMSDQECRAVLDNLIKISRGSN